MRHKKVGRKLGRSVGPRISLMRSLAKSLITSEKIETTEAKAKEVKKFVEKIITIAKNGDLHSRRIILSYLPHPATVKKIFDNIVPRYKEKPGGYLQIFKSRIRRGDSAQLVILKLISE